MKKGFWQEPHVEIQVFPAGPRMGIFIEGRRTASGQSVRSVLPSSSTGFH
jgi:hypothetical protein